MSWRDDILLVMSPREDVRYFHSKVLDAGDIHNRHILENVFLKVFSLIFSLFHISQLCNRNIRLSLLQLKLLEIFLKLVVVAGKSAH